METTGRWGFASEAIAWIRATRLRTAAFLAIVFAFFGLLLVGLLLAHDHGFLKEFSERLLEALLIAGIISLVLDGVAKAELAESAATRVREEWQQFSNEGLWVLLNRDAWQEHKDMVIAMAQKKTFLGQSEWIVTVEDDPEHDELLRLIVEFEGRGQTFDHAGTFPYGDAPLLASSDKRTSRHLAYRAFHVEGDRGRQKVVIDVDEEVILKPENGLTKLRSDGAMVLLVDRLREEFSRDNQRFQPKDRFMLRQKAEVFRHRRGFFPMWMPWTSCDTSVKVVDKSSRNLQFTLARLDQLQVHPLISNENKQIGLLPPGCAFILSWSET